MTIYLVLFCLCWLPLLIGSRPSTASTCLLFAAATFFAGLRYETGYDWPVYSDFYETLNSVGNLAVFSSPAFVFWVHTFRSVGIDYLFFQLSVSVFLSFLLYLAFKSKARGATYVSFLLYLAIVDLYLIHHFSILRQGVALGLVWIGLRYYCKGKNNWYIFILIASLFQVTALMTFIGFAVTWVITKFRWASLLLLIAGSINFLFNIKSLSNFILFSSFSSEWIGLYLDRDTFDAGIVYRIYIFIWVIMSVLVIHLTRHHQFKFLPEFIQENVVGVAFTAPILYLFTYDMPTVSSRISSFFGYGIILIIVEFVLSRRASHRILAALIGFILSSVLLIRFLGDPLSIVYVPYQTWFFNLDIENSTGFERTHKLIDNLNFLWNL